MNVKKKAISYCCSILLAILFIYAAIYKLIDYKEFATQLKEYKWMGNLSLVAALFIPFVEILTSILLLFQKTRKIGLYFSAVLMLGFSVLIFSFLYLGAEMPCPCGGILSEMEWNTHFWFNVSFLLIAITGIALHPTEKQTVSNSTFSKLPFYGDESFHFK